jgi:hypothetical protein
MNLSPTFTPKKRAFLKAYVECGQIVKAARCVGISKQAHYEWLDIDPEYVKVFAEAKKEVGELLEAEAIRRAHDGCDDPVVYQGQFTYPIGEDGKPDTTKPPLAVKKYSDTLLIFLLKGAMPDKYKDRSDTILQNPDGTGILSGLKITYVGKPDSGD